MINSEHSHNLREDQAKVAKYGPHIAHLRKMNDVISRCSYLRCRAPSSAHVKALNFTAVKDNIILLKQARSAMKQVITQRYRALVANPTWQVRFTAGSDRTWQKYRVAADSKSTSSLQGLPQSSKFSFQYILKITSVVQIWGRLVAGCDLAAFFSCCVMHLF